MRKSIKLCCAALDELNDGTIVIRGVVDHDSLQHLKVDEYQREVQPLASLMKLVNAFKMGTRVPDIELGMRGGNFIDREGAYYLQDEVYIIDGQQRVKAARHGMTTGVLESPHIGCVVHCNTTKEWERDRFRILNTLRAKVSPNVLLRNMRDDYPAIEMLFNLTRDRSFALYDRVSWKQNMPRGQILTARTFAGIAGRLHAHIGPGRSNGLVEIATGLNTIMERVGRNTMRENIVAVFEFIDSAWGLRQIAYSEGTVHTKQLFLFTLAQLLSDHHNFWKDTEGKHFSMKASDGKKIASFPIADPTVRQLGSSGSTAGELLYVMMQRHFDSGKRTQRLRPSSARTIPTVEPNEEDALEAEVA